MSERRAPNRTVARSTNPPARQEAPRRQCTSAHLDAQRRQCAVCGEWLCPPATQRDEMQVQRAPPAPVKFAGEAVSTRERKAHKVRHWTRRSAPAATDGPLLAHMGCLPAPRAQRRLRRRGNFPAHVLVVHREGRVAGASTPMMHDVVRFPRRAVCLASRTRLSSNVQLPRLKS